MTTKTITIDSLYADYANRTADVIGLDLDDYEPTAHGLATLLRDASENSDDSDAFEQVRDWLDEAAADLDTVARLGDDDPKTQKLLNGIEVRLCRAVGDLEMG